MSTLRKMGRRVLSLDIGYVNFGLAVLEFTSNSKADTGILFPNGMRAYIHHTNRYRICKKASHEIMANNLLNFTEATILPMVDEYEIDTVLIEKQVRASPLNMCLLHRLAGFLQGRLTMARNDLHVIMPINKFRLGLINAISNTLPVSTLQTLDESWTASRSTMFSTVSRHARGEGYKNLKLRAEATMGMLLKTFPEIASDQVNERWSREIAIPQKTKRKADDMADAMLQGFVAMEWLTDPIVPIAPCVSRYFKNVEPTRKVKRKRKAKDFIDLSVRTEFPQKRLKALAFVKQYIS